MDRPVTVFGASGHTGRFVVSELCRRGRMPILSGRDSEKLGAVGHACPVSVIRVASIEEPASLDRALANVAAVVNCAGPFLDTAEAVIDAALRAGIPYLDVTAEAAVAAATFERFADRARAAGIPVVPAMAFFGGLGDLLATVAMDDWQAADEICIAVALDRWNPTRGTRLTGERRGGRRHVFTNGRLEVRSEPPPIGQWDFPAPFGRQEVVGELSTADCVTISRHLRTPEVRAYMNLRPIADLRDPATPGPTAVDERGRSAQIFLVDVVVRRGSEARRATARGQDIYAITAPLVVEALERILDGRVKAVGAVAAGEAFDARDLLEALAGAGSIVRRGSLPIRLPARCSDCRDPYLAQPS
jgi:Saccharopine dehydrogenase NADP binding domain